jgi:hypothetical protein
MSCISAFFAPRASMRRFLAAFTFKLAAVSFALATRISRADYAVTYKIRDARSGALVGRRADRPARRRQFGLEPRSALADPAPLAGAVTATKYTRADHEPDADGEARSWKHQ